MDGAAQIPTVVVVPAGEATTTGEQKFSDTGGSGGGALRVDNIKCNGCTPLAPCDCTTKYIEPQNGFIKSETTCMFAKTTVLSSQEIYNDEDIRSVYVNKAPFNSVLFNIMGTCICAGVGLMYAGGNDFLIYAFVAIALGLIAAFFFFLQCCRPTLGVNVFTSRMSFFPCNWSVFMETYKVRGTGPGISIQDPDDVGHKLLNRSQPENILATHKGKDIPKEGISQELIITNRRIGFKRRTSCCCKLVTLENSLWTYKLDEVANCHADSSFPLFFLIFCVWTLIVGLVAYLWQQCSGSGSSSGRSQDDGNYGNYGNDGNYGNSGDNPSGTSGTSGSSCSGLDQATYIMGAIWFIYFMLLNRCPGGIGCCRKSRIKVYFKSPSPLGFPSLLTDFDEMELPGGVSLVDGVEMTGAQGAANICSEIMRAKADYISKKKA